MNDFSFVRDIPDLKAILDRADDADVRIVDCAKDLPAFVADLLAYMPWWMRGLYRLRKVLVLSLGGRQDLAPKPVAMRPEDVPMAVGDPVSFFTVVASGKNHWAAEAWDRHISGCLAVAVEPLDDEVNRFHVMTAARYRHWTGRVYYAVIYPFHHVVVHCMARHAATA